MGDVAANLQCVREKIADVARAAGRTDDVTLVAVSKSVPIERILDAYHAGQRVFGENRVQEAVSKIEAARDSASEAEWHLIGHLQRNKAGVAAHSFALVSSVDSVALARKLSALREGSRLPVLLEVNVAGESAKFGFSQDGLREDFSQLLGLQSLELRGLMTIAPLEPDPEQVRWVFRELRLLRDELRSRHGLNDFDELSMGMSNDYEVAVKEGATMVRIGRGIFGERPH